MLDNRGVEIFHFSFKCFGVSSLLHKSLNIKLYFFNEFSRQGTSTVKRAFLSFLIWNIVVGRFYTISYPSFSSLCISTEWSNKTQHSQVDTRQSSNSLSSTLKPDLVPSIFISSIFKIFIFLPLLYNSEKKSN